MTEPLAPINLDDKNWLDRYIMAHLDENLENAFYKLLARRGGINLDWDFQSKLTEKWYSENKHQAQPQEGDIVRYSEDTPEYILQGRTGGYIKGDNSARWVLLSEVKLDD